MLSAAEIRASFIRFFKEKDHTFVPGAPVISINDPTLMFTNAGMNQFKDMFLGTGSRDYRRAVNSQACIRVSGKHNDLDEVGHDGHHTIPYLRCLGTGPLATIIKKKLLFGLGNC